MLMLAMYERGGQDGEKERATLCLSFIVVVLRVSCLWCGANVAGNKKSEEEAKKKQRKRLVNLCSKRGVLNPKGVANHPMMRNFLKGLCFFSQHVVLVSLFFSQSKSLYISHGYSSSLGSHYYSHARDLSGVLHQKTVPLATDCRGKWLES
jgi:hypothetical protein